MFANARNLVRKFGWTSSKSSDSRNGDKSFLFIIFIGVLEDALSWTRPWLSIGLILFVNIILFICALIEINLMEFVVKISIVFVIFDALETWLKSKHRTSFLKQLAMHHEKKYFYNNSSKVSDWFKNLLSNFIMLRETNHAKAFVICNIIFSIIFLIGNFLSGYTLSFILLMALLTLNLLKTPLQDFYKGIQQHAEAEAEIESLIPDISEQDLQDLSFEPENNANEKQSLDNWKPDELPVDDGSDSSDNSSSIATNLSTERLSRLDKDVDISESSDDEYIPLVQQNEHLQTTLEVSQPAQSWSLSAFNAIRNLTGAVSTLYSTDNLKKKRVSSVDSSDGFEIIDKNDVI